MHLALTFSTFIYIALWLPSSGMRLVPLLGLLLLLLHCIVVTWWHLNEAVELFTPLGQVPEGVSNEICEDSLSGSV